MFPLQPKKREKSLHTHVYYTVLRTTVLQTYIRTHTHTHIGHRNVEKHPPAALLGSPLVPSHIGLTLMTLLFFRDFQQTKTRGAKNEREGIIPRQVSHKKSIHTDDKLASAPTRPAWSMDGHSSQPSQLPTELLPSSLASGASGDGHVPSAFS